MNTTANKRGFTIIEVVLVLAIAALIMLMVFIAWPALQRNQRDTQRRSDVGRVMSQLEQYKTNNNGAYPTPANNGLPSTFLASYLDNDFKDPKTGANYAGSNNPSADGEYKYATKAKCNGENIQGTTSTREVAVLMVLEGSGKFCQDNQ